MCSITIDKVTGHVSGGQIVDIEVDGTASECGWVQVTLTCVGGANPPLQTTVQVNNGQWTAPYTKNLFDLCSCGQEVDVSVQCLGTGPTPGSPVPGCNKAWSGQLQCKQACPNVHFEMFIPKVSQNCNPDGTRTVFNIGAVVTHQAGDPPFPQIQAQLEWVENNNQVLIGPILGGDPLTLGPITHSFPPGPSANNFLQTLHVSVLIPSGCGGADEGITVAPCEPGPPVGACCLPTGTGMATCEVMTEVECNAKGGVYQGDNTKCIPNPCGAMPPPPPPGENKCGDGLIWAAAIAMFVGIYLLAIHNCIPVPQLQTVLLALGWALVVLSGLMIALWAIISLFTKCKLDWCDAAAIFMGVLGALTVLLALTDMFLFACFWKPAWWVFGAFFSFWNPIAIGCLTKKH